MAAPYYKYAEKDVTNEVNWSDISQQLVTTLEAKREKILTTTAEKDKEYQDYLNSLNNVAVSDNPDFNRWTADMTSNLQQANLELYRRLQRGEINLRDYNFYRNNLNTGTDAFLKTSSQVVEWQRQSAELLANNQMSALGIHMAARAEEFFNVTGTSAYINPKDYTMGVAGLEKDPETGGWKVSSNPGKITSFQQLLAGMGQQYKPFDINVDTKTFVDTLGQDIRVFMEAEGYRTIADVRQKAAQDLETGQIYNAFEAAKSNYLDSLMANPERSAFVLTNMTRVAPNGKQYAFTEDPSEVGKAGNEHLILITPDPRNPSSGRFIPQLSPEQETAVKRRLSQTIDSQLGYGEEFKQRVRYGGGGGGGTSQQGTIADRTADTLLANLEYLYAGTPEQMKTAEAFFKGRDRTIRQIERDADGYTIIYNDGKPAQRVDITTDGQAVPFDEFAMRSSVLADNAVIQSALERRTQLPQYSAETYGGTPTRQFVPSDKVTIYSFDENGKPIPYGTGVSQSFRLGLVDEKGEPLTDETDLANKTAELGRNALQSAFNERFEGAGMIIRPHDRDDYDESMPDDFVEVFVPSMMTEPIFIPMTSRKGESWKSNVADIFSYIIDEGPKALQRGERLAPEDFKTLYMPVDDNGNNAFETYTSDNLKSRVRTAYPLQLQPAAPAASTPQPAAGQPQQGGGTQENHHRPNLTASEKAAFYAVARRKKWDDLTDDDFNILHNGEKYGGESGLRIEQYMRDNDVTYFEAANALFPTQSTGRSQNGTQQQERYQSINISPSGAELFNTLSQKRGKDFTTNDINNLFSLVPYNFDDYNDIIKHMKFNNVTYIEAVDALFPLKFN